MRKQLPSFLTQFFLQKLSLKITVLIVLSLFALQRSFAQQWSIIGNENQISSVASAYTAITVLNSVPYVVYVETATGACKVKQLNSTTGTWDQVGGNVAANAIYSRIYSDENNKLYVTYVDVSNNSRLAIVTYNTTTQTWDPLISGNPYISTGTVTNINSSLSSSPRSSLAFDSNDNPYITYSERATNGNPFVQRFINGAWEILSKTAGAVSADFAVCNSIALDNNDVPYMVYIQQSSLTGATTGTIKVFRYSSADSSWTDISPLAGSGSTSTTAARHTSIVMDSTFSPMVSYFNTGNSNRSTVMRYNKTTSAWGFLGTNGTRDAPYNSLVRDNGGNVYNSFTDLLVNGGTSPMARVYKLSYGASAFVELKASNVSRGIDSVTVSGLNVAIGTDTSKPFIVYTNKNSSNVVTPIVQMFSQPIVTTPITNITSTSASTGGTITFDGGSTITERGIVYGTSINPTTTNTKIVDGSGGTGSFTTSIINLIPATTYHVRAYAINSLGTIYGNDLPFSTSGPDAGSVIVQDNGATVTMKNAKVAVTINKSNATITNITYNGQNLLNGGYNGGQLYWSWNMGPYQQPSGCTYTLSADPHNNSFNYGEIKLSMRQDSTATTAALDMDIYYSLPRDTSGFYASATLRHPSSYGHVNPGGEWRMAGYPGSTFNWLSVDSLRNKLMATNDDWGNPAVLSTSPPENMLLTTGIKKGLYECKYDYSADFGDQDAWGWSSTTDNVGLWMTAPSKEYYNGGPMKRELMCHASPTILNMLGGQHYGMGDDGAIPASETWEKTFGPFLIYCNSVPAGTTNAPIVLWKDAVAQAKKEQASWPYSWYTNPSYVQESGRGTITGTLAITDPGAPSASAANMWVGVAAQPANATTTDFQRWSKNYQFWVKTDANGNFTIPHVLPGTYNFYAFSAGAPATVAGQLTLNNYVTVTAGNTNALGTINWTPTRTAATVWEIGTPDRSAKEFLHGNDWWVSDTYVNADSTNWAKFRDYITEFPNDVNFRVGQSNIATDWDYVMPFDKGYHQSTSPVWTINFALGSAPTAGSTVSLYTALAANFSSALIVTVNGTNITNPTTGVTFGNKSDAMIRMGIHGAFTDARINFPASNLHAGNNTISLSQRLTGGATTGDLMFDYLRLEADGTTLTILPVTFGDIQAYQKNQDLQVDWQILTEANIKLYEVERSTDGQNFTQIGTVASKGNSTVVLNYGFLDVSPSNGNNFYRIKSVGLDGTVQYSKIVKVTLAGNGNSSLVIYPNPIIGNSIGLQLNNFETGTYTLTLTNKLGQQVFAKTIANNGTASSQTVMLDKNLAAGVYQLKLVGNNTVVTQQVIKE